MKRRQSKERRGGERIACTTRQTRCGADTRISLYFRKEKKREKTRRAKVKEVRGKERERRGTGCWPNCEFSRRKHERGEIGGVVGGSLHVAEVSRKGGCANTAKGRSSM
jgi:hypothetical protein